MTRSNRAWYIKKRYVFPLAFIGGGLLAFIQDLIKWVLN